MITLRPAHSKRELQAREDGLPVQEHRAGAALAQLAAVLRAAELEVLAQDLQERLLRHEGGLDGLAVHVQGDLHVIWHWLNPPTA